MSTLVRALRTVFVVVAVGVLAMFVVGPLAWLAARAFAPAAVTGEP